VTVTCSGSGVTSRTVAVSVTDNDQLTIVSSVSSVTLAENGTATFTVHLGAQPAATTTVTVASADTGAATISPGTLDFTTASWNTDQTVTVIGVHDVDMVNEAVALSLTATGLTTVPVSASITDVDTQAVLVTPTSLTVNEGATGTVYVTLRYQPAANTTVNVTLDSAIATASSSSLTFTPANYATAQPLTITGVQDNDGVNDTTTLSLTSTGATATSVAMTITDDDPIAVTIQSGSPASVLEGGTAIFTVRLAAQPSTTVDVTCTSNDTSSVTVSPATFSFTSATYNSPKTVTITGVEDADTLNDSAVVTCSAAGWTDGTVDVSAWDNDTIYGALFGAHMYEGDTATLQIKLTAQPVGNVTVNIASMDTATASVTITSRTFTPTNYSTIQTVTVTGVQDADTTNDSVTIALTATGYAPKNVTFTVFDNDTITTDMSSLSVVEGATVPIQVRFITQPMAGATLSVAMSGTNVATFDPPNVSFASNAWNTWQTIYVTGTVDADTTNDTATLTISSATFSPVHIPVTVIDGP
jgi:hypothetical protein